MLNGARPCCSVASDLARARARVAKSRATLADGAVRQRAPPVCCACLDADLCQCRGPLADAAGEAVDVGSQLLGGAVLFPTSPISPPTETATPRGCIARTRLGQSGCQRRVRRLLVCHLARTQGPPASRRRCRCSRTAATAPRIRASRSPSSFGIRRITLRIGLKWSPWRKTGPWYPSAIAAASTTAANSDGC